MKKVVLAIVVFSFMSGCAVRRPVVVTTDAPGPPAHAKAYGYRAKQLCWYYPDANVYYLINTRTYAVLQDGDWVILNAPPKGRVLGAHQVIQSDTDKPWLDNPRYKANNSSGKGGGNKGKGWKNK